MNETARVAWFYTREGERIGPVTLADLRVKAAESALNPRLDMVWTQGMAEWKPAGEIDGLFEKRAAPEPKESLAPSADPYAPPKHPSVEEQMSLEGGWPGVRRGLYIAATCTFPTLWNKGFAYGTEYFAPQLGPEIMSYVIIGGAFVPLFFWTYFSLQRLMNLGMSRWWLLGSFVPFLNFWVGYRCYACPPGYRYHKKLDGVGVFLAILYWLGVALVVLAVAVLVALLFGVFHNPELQDYVRKFLAEAFGVND